MNSKFTYTEKDKEFNRVLKMHSDDLSKCTFNNPETDINILETESLLAELGFSNELKNIKNEHSQIVTSETPIFVNSWENIVANASEQYDEVILEDIFTNEELVSNENYLIKLRDEFNAIHKLDMIDWSIPILAGILSGVIDIALVGIPARTRKGTSAGGLSNYIRDLFEKRFPPEEMERLGGKKFTKTPFDAQDNRNTVIDVVGLSAYYHRLLELGHDPILAFIVGVLDVLKGTMTTIDKNGGIVVQAIKNYADRQESSLFLAIAKVLRHLKSDFTTSMGLPAPLMGLFNLFQFGSVGEYEQTIAEIVQGMYYEGYDFIHFCSMSIPVMVTEVIVRISYGIKRKVEGNKLKDCIPFTANRTNHPKLGTELFIAHSVATAINTGKVAVTKNPLSINYPQWIAFAKYSFSQLKWILINKPEMRYKYVQGFIDDEWDETYSQIDATWKSFCGNRPIIELN